VRHREAEQLGGVQIDESSNFFDGITGRLTGFLSDAPHPSDHLRSIVGNLSNKIIQK